MTIFSVMTIYPAAGPIMAARLKERFPDDHIAVGGNIWFVAGSGTAKEMSDKLGVTPVESPETTSGVIVVSLTGYFGRAPAPIWEWLAAKMSTTAAK